MMQEDDYTAIVIRPAVVVDAPRVARVQIEAWQHAFAHILSPTYLQGLVIAPRAERWREHFLHSVEGIYVAEGGCEVIGFVNCGPSRDEDGADAGEIYQLYVHPTRWRSGAGRQLLNRAEEDLRGRGFPRATLWTLEDNARGRAFYTHHGYAEDGARQPLTIGEQQVWEVRYARQLTAG